MACAGRALTTAVGLREPSQLAGHTAVGARGEGRWSVLLARHGLHGIAVYTSAELNGGKLP